MLNDQLIEERFRDIDDKIKKLSVADVPDHRHNGFDSSRLYSKDIRFPDLYVERVLKTVSVGGNIQHAIDTLSAVGGGEVRLGTGTYVLNTDLVLYSGISLVGAGLGATTLDFGGGEFQVLVQGDLKTVGGTGVSITEGSTTVTGVGGTTFLTNIVAGDTLFTKGTTLTSHGMYAEVASVTDDDTLVLKNAWPYPDITNISTNIFAATKNVQIRDLTIANSSKGGVSGVLLLQYATNCLVENVLVTNNSITIGVLASVLLNSEFRNVESSYNGNTTTRHGFSFTFNRRCVLYNCTSIGNAGDGFSVGSQNFDLDSTNFLYSCFAEGNTGAGFKLLGVANLLSCRAFGNDGAGFEVTGDWNVLVNCNAVANGTSGVEIGSQGTQNTVENCLLIENGTFGIDIAGTINNIIGCVFNNNVSGSIQDAGTRTHYDNRGSGTFTAVNGANNNIDVSENRFVRISGPTAAFSISGIAGGVNGKTVTLYNAVAFDFTLTNDATSTAANRILTLTGADVTLTGVSVAHLVYNGTDARWILLGTQG